MIRARGGIGHSPAAPAQRMRSPRMSVTALATGPRPVPSHKLARMIATEGLGAGASRIRGGLPPQALKTSVVVRAEKTSERDSFILLCSYRWVTVAERPLGVGAHLRLLQDAWKECVWP